MTKYLQFHYVSVRVMKSNSIMMLCGGGNRFQYMNIVQGRHYRQKLDIMCLIFCGFYNLPQRPHVRRRQHLAHVVPSPPTLPQHVRHVPSHHVLAAQTLVERVLVVARRAVVFALHVEPPHPKAVADNVLLGFLRHTDAR